MNNEKIKNILELIEENMREIESIQHENSLLYSEILEEVA